MSNNVKDLNLPDDHKLNVCNNCLKKNTLKMSEENARTNRLRMQEQLDFRKPGETFSYNAIYTCTQCKSQTIIQFGVKAK